VISRTSQPPRSSDPVHRPQPLQPTVDQSPPSTSHEYQEVVDAVVIYSGLRYYFHIGFERVNECELGNKYGADEGFIITSVHEGALDDGDES